MRTLKHTFLTVCVTLCAVTSHAQGNQAQRKEAKEMVIKQAIKDKNFAFIPEYAKSDQGKEILINYNNKNQALIFKDGVITSYLPQVSGGQLVTFKTTSQIYDIQFESHKYELTTTEKKGKYTMVIKLLDCRDVHELIIDITPNGNYSSVRLLNYRYEPTNLTGKIESLKSFEKDETVD